MPFDQVNFEPPSAVDDAVLQVLIDARALLFDVTNWWPGGPRGGDFCASLALNQVCADGLIVARADDCLISAIPHPGRNIQALFDFNDTHSHADVLALFDRAIAARRAAIASKAA